MSNNQLDASFRQKADMSSVFNRQIDRKNLAGSYDYANAIGVVLNNLPMKWSKWVLDQKEKWEIPVETLVYKSHSGYKLGHADDPLVWNENKTDLGFSSDPGFSVKRLDDGTIDWNDPNIYSPYLVVKIEIDYEMKDSVVSEAAERAALTWTIDPLEQDAGDTEEYIKVQRKKTPLRLPVHLQKLLKKALEMQEKGLIQLDDEVSDTKG